jgi:hypothetical protein
MGSYKFASLLDLSRELWYASYMNSTTWKRFNRKGETVVMNGEQFASFLEVLGNSHIPDTIAQGVDSIIEDWMLDAKATPECLEAEMVLASEMADRARLNDEYIREQRMKAQARRGSFARVGALTRQAESVSGVCAKCNGMGQLPHMGHVEGGVCFRCNGTGKARI